MNVHLKEVLCNWCHVPADACIQVIDFIRDYHYIYWCWSNSTIGMNDLFGGFNTNSLKLSEPLLRYRLPCELSLPVTTFVTQFADMPLDKIQSIFNAITFGWWNSILSEMPHASSVRNINRFTSRACDIFNDPRITNSEWRCINFWREMGEMAFLYRPFHSDTFKQRSVWILNRHVSEYTNLTWRPTSNDEWNI